MSRSLHPNQTRRGCNKPTGGRCHNNIARTKTPSQNCTARNQTKSLTGTGWGPTQPCCGSTGSRLAVGPHLSTAVCRTASASSAHGTSGRCKRTKTRKCTCLEQRSTVRGINVGGGDRWARAACVTGTGRTHNAKKPPVAGDACAPSDKHDTNQQRQV